MSEWMNESAKGTKGAPEITDNQQLSRNLIPTQTYTCMPHCGD